MHDDAMITQDSALNATGLVRGSPSGSSVRSEETASPLARRVAMNVGEPVANVSDMSQNNPFYSVLPETTVAQVAGVFARGTHRLAVMQPGGVEIRGILSQTRVVRYFFEHCAVTGPSGENNGSKAYISEAETQLLDRTLGDLGLVSGNHVVSAKPTMPVIQALSLLEEHHVSSLPLVDEQMRVVGNFSVADAKYLARERKLVDATCMELIQAVRFMQGVNEGQDRAAVFAVRPQATLRHALAKLVATGAHRLWITQPQDDDGSGGLAVDGAAGLAGVRNRRASVSSTSSQTVGIAPAHYGGAFDDKLCGVVSLTDIMRLLIQAAPSPPQNPEYDYASMD
ncbi:cell separation during budding [Coemansia sp. Benny D115]|nr:cell separation during budding [Coemansia sp. Benny D115]